MKQSQLIRIYIDYENCRQQKRFLNYIPMYIFVNASIRLYRYSR